VGTPPTKETEVKARRAKAWKCSSCGKIYRDTKRGKEMANRCCTCCDCGGPGQYRGGWGWCAACLAKKDLKSAQSAYDHAAERLRQAKILMQKYAAQVRRKREAVKK
jgi:hypothetical protein